MFGLFSRSRRRPTPPRRTRLALEALESRDCPAGFMPLSITMLSATPTSGTAVMLSGHEATKGVDPTTTVITFSGVMSGTVTPDAEGDFTFTDNADALGEVDAVATDGNGHTSATAAVQLTNYAGWGLELTNTIKTGTTVQLLGQVTAADPTETLVTFTGVMSGSVTPNADGTFVYVTQASQLGTVNGTVTDDQDNTQAVVQTVVQCDAPVITNFAVTLKSGTNVILTGNVVAQTPGSVSLNFLGALAATGTTNADGSFSVTTTAARLGIIMGQAIDVWGQISTTATVTLTSPPPSIQSFGASNNVSGIWVLQGQLNNGAAGYGWTVTITGLPDGTITSHVLSDGSFWESLSLNLQYGISVTATVTDQWGQQDFAGATLTP